MAWARAVVIDKVYFSNENAIHMPFEFYTNNHMAKGVALIDSGATHNFMDRRMMKWLQLGLKPLTFPRSIRNVDRTSNKDRTLTRYTDLEVSVNQHTQIQQFYITDLAEDRALFGFPWLQEYNPQINWKKGTMGDVKVTIRTTKLEPPEWVQISQIVLIRQHLAQKTKMGEDDEVHLVINKTNLAQQWAEVAQKGKEVMMASTILEHYMEYKEVFSEEAACCFPQSEKTTT